ncbi:SIMPL domain-containing protein [Tanticharoenia sakaeratensis]|jgi:uncharacterized protein|uniref:DUF541 domain-containing protein n=1 Tax=Tanticharoenia sakaeratensis NBRC 103193 TaxID=1231623 RepID=A0A0D6MIQ8_9PROT|nr:SIMPL domain-containing protein [Tanticharoenia sakaeratensis]GAN53512.1 hypothetical protein Tasa_010_059 [Tanticharoenia sakaeratensis NBRC 103193]GBQ17690.1 hypothetical protein AA103193_0428 [Tanticharoenia sakaeratensis NBRC 103193]
MLFLSLLSRVAVGGVLIAMPVTVWAQATPTDPSTELSLDAEGRADASPDTFTATLFAQATSASLSTAQGTLNTMVDRAMTTAKGHPGIDVTRAEYEASQNTDKPAHWVAQQTIRIRSTGQKDDGKVVLETVAALQAQGLGVSGLDWSISPEHRDALVATARLNAIHALQAQARAAAEALGLHVVRFKTVNLATSGGFRPQVMMAARFASPQSTPQTQDVQVTASGTAILAP